MKCRICDREYVAFRDLVAEKRFWACPVHNPIIGRAHEREPEAAS